MKYIFVDESWEDYLYWQKPDKQKLKRINELLKDNDRHPFEGIGKPEPLELNTPDSGQGASMINTGLFTVLWEMKYILQNADTIMM